MTSTVSDPVVHTESLQTVRLMVCPPELPYTVENVNSLPMDGEPSGADQDRETEIVPAGTPIRGLQVTV